MRRSRMWGRALWVLLCTAVCAGPTAAQVPYLLVGEPAQARQIPAQCEETYRDGPRQEVLIPAPPSGWSGAPQAVNVLNVAHSAVVIEHGDRRVCGILRDARTLDSRFTAGVGTVLTPPEGDTAPVRVSFAPPVLRAWPPNVHIGVPAQVQGADSMRFAIRVACIAIIVSLAFSAFLTFVGSRERAFLAYAGFALVFAFWLALLCGLTGYPRPWFEMAGLEPWLLVSLSLPIVYGVLHVLAKLSGLEHLWPRARALTGATAWAVLLVATVAVLLLPHAALPAVALGAEAFLLLACLAAAAVAVVSIARGRYRAVSALACALPFLLLAVASVAGPPAALRYKVEAMMLAGTLCLTIAVLNLQLRLGSLRRQRDAMQVLADTDALTGLANRRAALRELPGMLDAARDGGAPLAIAFLDVDHFKHINDGYGHEIGDRVLVEVAHRLRDGIRASDRIARMGGEEFLVVMPGAPPAAARQRLEALRGRMAAVGPALGCPDLEVTISAGLAHLGDSDGSVAQLLRMADDAMYGAKRAGRNRVVEAVPMPDGATALRGAAGEGAAPPLGP
ncbi:diguanylate cyclase [Coralloluteibacterium thermophilus]|uniref:diguanylate cyclase n=1 Tax=Coralloluteibacterium thermophilum TaxID=2707049 RepID=A0ABV9NJ38_9GAMM